VTAGGFFGGDRVQLNPQFRLRVGDRFNTEISWDRNDVDLPWGQFVTNLGRTRVSYSFSPRVFVQGLLQYNDRATYGRATSASGGCSRPTPACSWSTRTRK
jgi:hypothetical protein